MFKVLTFMDNQVALIEAELNKYKGWNVVATWPTMNKLVIIIQDSPKPGRPAKKSIEE